MIYERRLAWSVLFRLFHWFFALSIVALVVTGFYIGDPWTNTTVIKEGKIFTMEYMRYVHFIAGFVFTGAVIVRIYLWGAGNRQEKIMDFLPVTSRNLKNLFSTVAFYLYLKDNYEDRLGHNALAGLFYLITIVMAVLQIISGFYMFYPESSFWQSCGLLLFGTQGQGRFLHHLFMWYFILFAFVHFYIVVWNDIRCQDGLISSIFNGRKFRPKKV